MASRRPRWIPRYATPGSVAVPAVTFTLVAITQLATLHSGDGSGFNVGLLIVTALGLIYGLVVSITLARHPEWVQRKVVWRGDQSTSD